MSRTDKTAPYRVKARYEQSYLIERHDHRDGRACDIPAEPTLGEYRQSGCHWTTSPTFHGQGLANCGCPQCRYGLRAERRSARHAARRDIADRMADA